MISIENKFEKGQKVWTVGDATGEFKLYQTEVEGFVYQDLEKDTPPRLLYKVMIDGVARHATEDILFNVKSEAIATVMKMLPRYEEQYDKELQTMIEQTGNLSEAKRRMLDSAKLLLEVTEEDVAVQPSAEPAVEEPKKVTKKSKNG